MIDGHLTFAHVREVIGEPSELVIDKELDHLDVHAKTFIAASPFVVVSSARADGRADASPKGDAPGFVRVLDDLTLLIPERPGNRRVDTLKNVVENPHVGLLFLLPGTTETLRVNGRARIVDDPELLESMAVGERLPKLALAVEVEEVFFHCARALLRARLWQQDTWPDPKARPTLGQILADQIASVTDVAALDAELDEDNRNLYVDLG